MKTYRLAPDNSTITCLVCGKTSHHPKDVEHRYCGWCHRFHHDPVTITLSIPASYYCLLRVLGPSVEAVINKLIDHAQQGVYRPGAWERNWLLQAFGDDFTANLEPGDPYGRAGCEFIFQRPREDLEAQSTGESPRPE